MRQKAVADGPTGLSRTKIGANAIAHAPANSAVNATLEALSVLSVLIATEFYIAFSTPLLAKEGLGRSSLEY